MRETKEYKWRREGMLYAHKIVKEGGLEALDKEIKMRGFLKLDIWAKKEDVEHLQRELGTNLYNSMLSTMFFTLHDLFGFAGKRLHKLKDGFDKNVGNIFNLDWVGNNYLRFEDYAVYVNENFGFNFEASRIAALHDLQLEGQEGHKRLDRASTVEWLRDNGFPDAAAALEKEINKAQ